MFGDHGNGSSSGRWAATAIWVLAGAAFVSLALAVAPGPAAAAPATLQVETGGTDSGDCVTSPCKTIQYAVEQAGAGDTIQVGPGTYEESVTVENEIALRGANAGVPANGSRGAETVIAATGAGTKALTITGSGVSVDGFTVTSDAAYALYAGNTSGLRVADSIIQSGQRALTLAAGAEAATIEGNLIEGGLYGLVASGVGSTFRDLVVADNTIIGAASGNYAMFNAGESTFPGLQVLDNQFRGNDNIGGNVEGGTIAGNTFTAEAEGLGLQIDLHESTVSGNSFEGGGVGSCLQVFGSQYGLDPSDGATISGNRFHGCAPFGIQLSPDIENVAITGNTITDSYDGIDTRLVEGEAAWDLDGRSISVAGNRIVGSSHMGIDNSVEGTIEAADNWWGCNAGPAPGGGNGCDVVSAGVQPSPWLVLTSSAPASVGIGASATVTATIDTDSSGAHVAAVPDGTPVSYSTDLGSLDPLTATTTDGVAASTLVSPVAGVATVTATVDHQTVGSTVTIQAPPVTASAAEPTPPKVKVAGNGSPVRVSSAGTVTVANVACPQGSCRIAIKQRKIKIGNRGFPLSLKLDKLIDQGESTAVTAVLPSRATRALGTKVTGQVIVRLRLFSGAGMQEVPIRVRVKAPKTTRQPG